MSQTLTLKNFDSLNILGRTTLTNDVARGAVSLPVEDSAQFTSGSALLGLPSSQTSEIATTNAPTQSNLLPLASGTTQSHNFGEDIFMLFGERLRVYRANDQYGTGQQPDDSQFSLLAGGTVLIDGSSPTTTFTDTTGVPGQWYKYTYYNQAGSAETQLSDSEAAQAGQTHYCSIDDIREAAGFTNSPNVTDQRISKKRAAAEQEINGALIAIYQLPLPKPTNPIVVEIAKQLAAGMLIHELYVDVSKDMAEMGEKKASTARMGGGSFTGLQELVNQVVVLLDAKFNDTSTDENVHGFGGYPDETATDNESGKQAAYFSTDEEY